jgi:hypothetical protein
MSQYDTLAPPNGVSVLWQLHPMPGDVDCPATADVVDDYLNTGEIVPWSGGYGTVYTITASWHSATSAQALASFVLGLGRDHHVVVRGTRPDGSTHYFVVANIARTVYVIDAQAHLITQGVQAYCDGNGFNQLDYTRSYEASPQFIP